MNGGWWKVSFGVGGYVVGVIHVSRQVIVLTAGGVGDGVVIPSECQWGGGGLLVVDGNRVGSGL